MDADRRPVLGTRLVVGLTLLALGTILLLDNLGVVDGQVYLDWLLPLGALGLAVACVTQARRSYGWGIFWGVVGILLVGNRLGYRVHFDLTEIAIPALLVLLGVVLVRRSLSGPRPPAGGGGDSGATVDIFAALAGNETRNSSQEFRGGNAAAFMGACKLDLRQAKAVKPGAVLDVLAFWGGVEILVPADWKVNGKVVPLLGAYVDKTRPVLGETGGELTIRGFAVMGGVDVYN